MVSARKRFAALLAAGLFTSGVAFAGAGINITVDNSMGAVGGTVTIMYDYVADDSDDVGGFQFDLTYDPVALTPTDVSMCGNNAPATHTAACTEPGGVGNGTIRTLLADFAPPTAEIMPTAIADFGQFTFMINQPGTHTLTFTNGTGADVNAMPVAINGNNATITGNIVGAAGFASTPAPGSTIDLGIGIAVGDNISLFPAVTVMEIGDMALNVMAPSFGGTEFASTTGAFSIPNDDVVVSVDVEVNCTPAARGIRTDTMTLMNNSVNEPNASYDLTCIGLSPNIVVAPLVINLNGIIGMANPSDSFTITNAQDGFTFMASNASLAESGTAEISITDGLTNGTIDIDETDTVTVECSTAAPGMFTETITFQWDEPNPAGGFTPTTQDIVVNCEIINEIAEYVSVPAEGSTLDFGLVLNGSTSAALGIDIGNTNTDAVPNGTLSITGASIAGPDAGVFALVTDPTGDTFANDEDPDGTPDAEVTCSPTDGFSTFTATLTITSNDPDTPHTYPLTCEGDSDEGFDSDPPPGSTLDLGFLLPGMDTNGTIIMFNTGTTDPIAVDCSLSGDPELTLVSPTFPINIGPGASTNTVINCAVPSPGLFTATLSCNVTGVAGAQIATPSYDIRCTGAAVEVPTLSRFGLIALVMTLMLGGFVAFRLRQN